MKLKFSVDGISEHFKEMASRARLTQGWLNRVAYPRLIKAQRMRWQTEGASEDEKWEPLNPEYRRSKLKRFADYPGGGRKLLIATGRLIDSMTGENSDHWKLVTPTLLEVGTIVPYAGYVDEARDITSLSDQTVEEIADGLAEYITEGSYKKL